jgi:hypothetical protein
MNRLWRTGACTTNPSAKEIAMHDIDRTVAEYEAASDEYEYEYEYEGEYEDEGSGHEAEAFEYEGEAQGNAFEGEDAEGAVFDESEEMELAAELLSVSNEGELDQFLGKVFGRAGRLLGRFVKSPIGNRLKGYLKGAIRKALPTVAGTVGGMFGGPVGAALGGKVASAASGMFGLEMEGLSHEDQEFEVARRLVRLSGDAARNASEISPHAEPQSAARAATIAAARRHAPGLLRAPSQRGYGMAPGVVPSGLPSSRHHSGRWVRRGRKIVLLGV